MTMVPWISCLSPKRSGSRKEALNGEKSRRALEWAVLGAFLTRTWIATKFMQHVGFIVERLHYLVYNAQISGSCSCMHLMFVP